MTFLMKQVLAAVLLPVVRIGSAGHCVRSGMVSGRFREPYSGKFPHQNLWSASVNLLPLRIAMSVVRIGNTMHNAASEQQAVVLRNR